MSQVVQDDSNYCYMDHDTRIGHPFDELCGYVEQICRIDRCKSDCNMEEEYKGHKNYYEYLDEKLDECRKEHKWWTEEKVELLREDYLEKLFTLKGKYGCHIRPKDVEYAKIEDPFKEIPQKLKYKKVK